LFNATIYDQVLFVAILRVRNATKSVTKDMKIFSNNVVDNKFITTF